jgi:hypothetical protein
MAAGPEEVFREGKASGRINKRLFYLRTEGKLGSSGRLQRRNVVPVDRLTTYTLDERE